MDRKAQVIIISLWILLIFTVLTVSISHRVSMALRLSQYQRDGLKALYLAKAGINRAIVEIIEDKTLSHDGLNDNWADNEDVFKKILSDNNQTDFATVSYTTEENKETKTRFGLIDEERSININIADQELLKVLLEGCGISTADAQTFANNIRAWRGSQDLPLIPQEAKNYREFGYPCKEKNFANVEELTLVKGISPEIYEKMKGLIAAYGNGKVNINTASKEVLKIWGLKAVGALKNSHPDINIDETDVDELVEIIHAFREGDGYFENSEINTEAIKGKLKLGDMTGDNRTKIIDNLIPNLTAVSSNFRIEATGYSGRIARIIISIYNRKDKKILYWHEG